MPLVRNCGQSFRAPAEPKWGSRGRLCFCLSVHGINGNEVEGRCAQ